MRTGRNLSFQITCALCARIRLAVLLLPLCRLALRFPCPSRFGCVKVYADWAALPVRIAILCTAGVPECADLPGVFGGARVAQFGH